VILRILNFY